MISDAEWRKLAETIVLGVAAAAILGPSAMDSMQSPSIHKEVTHGH
jgi:hypothetical protein